MPWMLSCSVSRTTFLVDRRLSCLALLCSLMCALPAHRRTTLPVPVVRNRFAADCARQGQGVRCDAATRATRGASARAGAGVRRRSDERWRVFACARQSVHTVALGAVLEQPGRSRHARPVRTRHGGGTARPAQHQARRNRVGAWPTQLVHTWRLQVHQGGGGVWRVGWDGRPRGTSRVLLSITSARAARRLATAGRRHAAPLLRGGRVQLPLPPTTHGLPPTIQPGDERVPRGARPRPPGAQIVRGERRARSGAVGGGTHTDAPPTP